MAPETLPFILILAGSLLTAIAVYLIIYGNERKLSHQDLKPLVPQPQVVRLGPAAVPQEPWSLKTVIQEFKTTKQSISDLDDQQVKPGKQEGLKSYFGYLGVVWKLMICEKEIITFSLLQWSSVAVGYYLWVQMLGWIPAEVWKSAEHSRHASLPDLILMAWSFVCVGVAALPLCIFSACIGAVYFLRRQGYPSSIAACLKIVLPGVWALWVFQWMDGWITVNQILERLPKKNDRKSLAKKALSEALYFAWKLGTIGILPALITGRGMVESCRDSVSVVKTKFLDAARLRVGYSFLCWILGIATYVGTIYFFIWGHFIPRHAEVYGSVYKFYFWAGIPILTAVAVIELFLRPAYIVGSCELYAKYLTEQNKTVMLPQPPTRGISAFVFFAALCLLVVIVFLYRGPLGINAALATLYH